MRGVSDDRGGVGEKLKAALEIRVAVEAEDAEKRKATERAVEIEALYT